MGWSMGGGNGGCVYKIYTNFVDNHSTSTDRPIRSEIQDPQVKHIEKVDQNYQQSLHPQTK